MLLHLLLPLLQKKHLFVKVCLEINDQMDGPSEHQYIHNLSLKFQYVFERARVPRQNCHEERPNNVDMPLVFNDSKNGCQGGSRPPKEGSRTRLQCSVHCSATFEKELYLLRLQPSRILWRSEMWTG